MSFAAISLFSLETQQKNAWLVQIANLKQQLRSFPQGEIFLEFSIPRMDKRVDVLLSIKGVIWVIEYKVGAKTHDKYAIDQTVDYALDLKNFMKVAITNASSHATLKTSRLNLIFRGWNSIGLVLVGTRTFEEKGISGVCMTLKEHNGKP